LHPVCTKQNNSTHYHSFRHSDGSDLGEDEGVITTPDDDTIDPSPAEISSDTDKEDPAPVETPPGDDADKIEHADSSKNTTEGDKTVSPTSTKTVGDVYDAFSDEEKSAVDIIVAEAVAEATGSANSDGTAVQHAAFGGYSEGFTHAMNLFDQNEKNKQANLGGGDSLSHDNLRTMLKDGVKYGSLKESYLEHADEYGITNIEVMFPDARLVGDAPELIARQADWVPKVLGSTKHQPFARIKSITADITAPEARAKGYVKGTRKTEEVLEMLKRTTGPATIYKKQKLDRDDILDITDFNVVVWLKWEIRFMLDEEIARAILVGDNRSSGSADKVKDPAGSVDGVGIRSILRDDDLYAIKKQIAANTSNANLVKEITRSRVDYRGSGTPTLYTTDALLTDLLLEEDKMGRRLYETEASLAAALRVKEIVPVEVFSEYASLLGIIVNLVDYTVGTNAGGEVSFFEDFDIDFNQNKYLMETRMSGALTKPKSAIVITRDTGTLVVATQPTFDPAENEITIPTVTGVSYIIDGETVTGVVTITEDTEVFVEATTGHYLGANTTRSWTFTYEA